MTATRRKPTRAKGLGVTDAEYVRLLDAQGGHCAICTSTPKTRRLHVDHDHATGEVRGLLCHRCNRNLPTWVTRAWLWNACLYLNDETLEAGAVVLWARNRERPDFDAGERKWREATGRKLT